VLQDCFPTGILIGILVFGCSTGFIAAAAADFPRDVVAVITQVEARGK
jgi:hypothetical protein